VSVDVSKAMEAAQVLYRGGERRDSLLILKSLWEGEELNVGEEFRVFCAMVEVWTLKDASSVVEFLDSVISGEGTYHGFWGRRSVNEQAILLDWMGLLSLNTQDPVRAFEFFGRAASLGRDTHELWKNLGSLYIKFQDLELGLRYVRRSFQLYRQMDLNLLSGKEEILGTFSGTTICKSKGLLEEYLEILLHATRLAKGQRNLKGVRELVVEMIHQFPEENRLPKIRLLIESAVVESSLRFTAVSPKTPERRLANESRS